MLVLNAILSIMLAILVVIVMNGQRTHQPTAMPAMVVFAFDCTLLIISLTNLPP